MTSVNTEMFTERHIGPSLQEQKEMLTAIGVDSIEQLIEKTLPASIRLKKELDLANGVTETAFLELLTGIAQQNKVNKSYIGLGYYETVLPSPILRNILENPSWYTAYTPYQAEISQGRLEAMFNYQTMISDLTGLPIANSSLLDEATAAAEAMTMLYRGRSRDLVKRDANSFFVSEKCFPQTIDVVIGRAKQVGINVVVGNHETTDLTDDFYGVLLQYPDLDGKILDYASYIASLKEKDIKVAVATDLMSLALLVPPGEFGASVVLGSTQRFGLPMGFGGPHAGFFATSEAYTRQIPGRIIGVSQDRLKNNGYRMALQTREQHIRREKATSNICTAQALLAVLSGFYAAYHGPQGIKRIASKIHYMATLLNQGLKAAGYNQVNNTFFDTLKIELTETVQDKIKTLAETAGLNFRYTENNTIHLSVNETTTLKDVQAILAVFAKAIDKSMSDLQFDINAEEVLNIPEVLIRKSLYLQQPVFNSYRSETKLMRYMKKLEDKDLALNTAMIPLGSCTMKLNSATSMLGLSWPEFANIHPFAPQNQTQGYNQLIKELEKDLAEITGFNATLLQPNAGSQGEYTGLLVIKAYYDAQGQSNRNVVLIPASAHGTNPASAALAGMKIVITKCDENGNISLEDLKEKAEKYKEELCAFMVTYPSTHGVFEEEIKEMCKIIHACGGQVYMDGANMNAQCGLTSPGSIGADVCHLNLHKTFGIPHGGGGPGVGPICVAAHLAPFLPNHSMFDLGHSKAINAVSAAPYGGALVLLITYAYIKMLGKDGLKLSTEIAILNANYMRAKLETIFPVLYTGKNGMVAHEMIVDFREYKKTAKIEVEDIAKRLMDYGFHAPTMAFPVPGTLMVEPTESEDKGELDRFIEAMVQIKKELEEIINGEADIEDNVLKMSPHAITEVAADNWDHKYSRNKAAFPVSSLKTRKFWPAVARIDNAYGDRNLICTAESVSQEKQVFKSVS